MKSNTTRISSRDWWTTLKNVIAPNTSTSIPPLQNNDSVSHDDLDKANILNDFFRDQAVIDEPNAVLPHIDPYPINIHMHSLHFSPAEIESVLKSLKTVQIRMELTTVFFVNYLRNLLSKEPVYWARCIYTMLESSTRMSDI